MSKVAENAATVAGDMTTEPAPPIIAAPAGAHAMVGTLLADRYRVDQLLGEGGMGQVFRAEHVHMRKAVALKVLHRELTMQPEIVARFEREAVAAARIEHPHVAAATDFGRLADGSFYLVLEFVEGESLTALMAKQGRLPVARALAIARQISDALCAAHEAGVVHRDLKPDNVMLVERENTSDYVKVLDFGIAKLQSEDSSEQPVLTKAGTVFGTPEYMAPEQAQGAVADARADLYTLGMMLYEMLSGRTAFADPELIVVLTRQMTAKPPALPTDVEPEVSELVMTLLEKNPADRVQTALELRDRLDGLLGGPPSSSVLSQAYSAALPEIHESSESSPMRAHLESLAGSARMELIGALPRVRAQLMRPLEVRGHTLPLWIPLALALGVLIIGFVALGGDDAVETANAAPTTDATDASDNGEEAAERLKALVTQASRGDRAALGELRSLAAKDPQAWMALGRGYARLKHFEASLEAYDQAVELDPALGADPELLRAVWSAAGQPGEFDKAFALAEKLGASGADLIFEWWTSRKGDPSKKADAARLEAALEKPALKQSMSPALGVALELNRAKGCASFKQAMSTAAEHADARSLGKLQPLTQKSGCGFLGLRDCYRCLRGNSDLTRALSRARSVPAPSFTERSEPAPATAGKTPRERKSLSRAGAR